MPLQYDPEYQKVFEPLMPILANRPKLAVNDIIPNRKARDAGVAAFLDKIPDSPDVEQTYHHTEAPDGHSVPILGFTKKDVPQRHPGPAILHFHGGGLIVGSANLFSKPLARLVSQTTIPIFSVDYRLAPEHTNTTLVDDCYAALVWLHQNAHTLNINPARIAVYGESAGGGLAVGVGLMARDRDLHPPLAKQILVYPMLDDRNMTANEVLEPLAFWKTADNVAAWTAVLGEEKAGKPGADVSPYVAPARAKSVAGLPSAYIDVGGLDIFRDEDIMYATRLLAEDIETELHVYPGVPHAFELVAPDISVTKRAFENRLKAMQSF
ncbi:putative Alpha/beta hydrolase fold-3 domain-containing protein [Seiridium cardinale]|uniref:Alpha/beta hydrolase fold-3 domain-containing protein n=1 Tax=Seiridium cardinale TaxID=138064 RepID=A0ABR2XMQ4_9PEZI